MERSEPKARANDVDVSDERRRLLIRNRQAGAPVRGIRTQGTAHQSMSGGRGRPRSRLLDPSARAARRRRGPQRSVGARREVRDRDWNTRPHSVLRCAVLQARQLTVPNMPGVARGARPAVRRLTRAGSPWTVDIARVGASPTARLGHVCAIYRRRRLSGHNRAFSDSVRRSSARLWSTNGLMLCQLSARATRGRASTGARAPGAWAATTARL